MSDETLKDLVDNLLPSTDEDSEVRVPDDDEWLVDSAHVMALRTEMPAVKGCLYDRMKEHDDQASEIEVSPRPMEKAKYSTDYLKDIVKLHEAVSDEVQMIYESDKCLKIISEDMKGRKTVTLLAPRIEE